MSALSAALASSTSALILVSLRYNGIHLQCVLAQYLRSRHLTSFDISTDQPIHGKNWSNRCQDPNPRNYSPNHHDQRQCQYLFGCRALLAYYWPIPGHVWSQRCDKMFNWKVSFSITWLYFLGPRHIPHPCIIDFSHRTRTTLRHVLGSRVLQGEKKFLQLCNTS